MAILERRIALGAGDTRTYSKEEMDRVVCIHCGRAFHLVAGLISYDDGISKVLCPLCGKKGDGVRYAIQKTPE